MSQLLEFVPFILCQSDIQSGGNKLLKWCCRFLQHCIQHGVMFVVENPRRSKLWLMPPIIKIMRKCSVCDVDYCQYGEAWQKRTRLLCFNVDLSVLMICKPKKGVCSATRRPHTRLSGGAPKGLWKTQLAEAYPLPLCVHIASVLGPKIHGLHTGPPGPP